MIKHTSSMYQLENEDDLRKVIEAYSLAAVGIKEYNEIFVRMLLNYVYVTSNGVELSYTSNVLEDAYRDYVSDMRN